MIGSTGSRGFLPAPYFSMASRKYFLRRVMSPRLRVIFCIMYLFMCISVTKGLDISAGKDIPSTESSLTGSGKSSGQVTDFVSIKDQEKRTGRHVYKLNKTGSLPELQTGEGPRKSQNEGFPGRSREVLAEKRAPRLKTDESSSNYPKYSAASKEEDGGSLKTWDQLWIEQALSPSLTSSDVDSLIDVEDYYTYDYFEDAEDDEGDGGGVSIDRSKKDTSAFTGEGKSHHHTLDLLAELVTGANPQVGLFSLSTPNPDIEITIEVLNGDEVKHGDVVISMDLRGDAVVTPDAPAPPTSRTYAEEDSEEVPDDGFAPLRMLPDPEANYFEPDEKGTWTDWSACSASCGGGRSERSRSCGLSCTATESKDCNQQSCPRRGNSEAHTEAISAESPRPPSLDTEYLEAVLDPQNLDPDSCEEWMGCRGETLLSYLSRLQDLPNCPCYYPTNIKRNSAIWDRQKRRMFRWMEASGEEARLDVYKPTATYCIVSMLSPHSTSLAAQQCCYDRNQRLITRGPGAGTPQLISAEISPELHYKIDIMPWIICKGDWTKYNKVRHPNNMWECKESPDQAEFYHLFQEAKNF